MRFDTSMMYYIGCFLLCMTIIFIIIFMLNVRRIIKNQELTIRILQDYGYQLTVLNENVHNIENDVYSIHQNSRTQVRR